MSREAPKIGLDSVYIAKVLSDTADGIVYDTPIALKGAVNISMNPNSSVETDYADNGAFVTMNNRGVVDATLELIDVDNAIIAQMLGQTYASGVVTEKTLDQSPYFAMMFRIMVAGDTSNPVYHLFCFAKGRFSVPETSADTKKDTIDFGHTTLNAQFINTIYDAKILCSHLRTDDPNANGNYIIQWFTQPILTGIANTGALTFAISGTGSNVVLTATKANAGSMWYKISLATVIRGQTVLALDESGNQVAFTATTDDTASASPKLYLAKATGANDIAQVLITSGVQDSVGGRAVGQLLTLA